MLSENICHQTAILHFRKSQSEQHFSEQQILTWSIRKCNIITGHKVQHVQVKEGQNMHATQVSARKLAKKGEAAMDNYYLFMGIYFN